MKSRLLLPVGLLSLLVGLVLWLPAPLAAGWIERAVPGLNLSGISGSALNGRAGLVSYQDVVLEDVNWHIHPASLLLGRLRVSLATATDTGRLEADLSRSLGGAVTIRDARGTASLAAVARQAGYKFLPMDGVLRLDNVSAALEGNSLTRISGGVALENSNWLLLRPPVALGRYSAELQTVDNKHQLQLAESDGPLAVEGFAQLDASNRYVLEIRLRPRPGADERLKKMLSEIGRAGADGWYPVRERGSLQ